MNAEHFDDIVLAADGSGVPRQDAVVGGPARSAREARPEALSPARAIAQVAMYEPSCAHQLETLGFDRTSTPSLAYLLMLRCRLRALRAPFALA